MRTLSTRRADSARQANRPDRELLADARAGGNKIAAFIQLFDRRGAASLWEKITHTLMMPLRRYWARQQVEEVLRIAQVRENLAGLPSIIDLNKKFNAGRGIREATAHAAAIELMIAGEIPDPSWRPAFDAYLEGMARWYGDVLYNETRGLSSRQPGARHAIHPGLQVLLDFARNPDGDVSFREGLEVRAFMILLASRDQDHASHRGPRFDHALSRIHERYVEALDDRTRVIELRPGA